MVVVPMYQLKHIAVAIGARFLKWSSAITNVHKPSLGPKRNYLRAQVWNKPDRVSSRLPRIQGIQ